MTAELNRNFISRQ